MKVFEFTDQYLKKLNEKEKSPFTSNAHKAFNAYINFIDSNDPNIKDVFLNLDKLFIEYKNRYSVNTVRNYCRYLQLTLFLEQVKSEFTSSEFEDVKNKINKLVKEADKLSNEDHKKKKKEKPVKTEPKDDQLALDDITINDGMSTSDVSDKPDVSDKLLELDSLKKEIVQLKQYLYDLEQSLRLETRIKDIYKEQLDKLFNVITININR